VNIFSAAISVATRSAEKAVIAAAGTLKLQRAVFCCAEVSRNEELGNINCWSRGPANHSADNMADAAQKIVAAVAGK